MESHYHHWFSNDSFAIGLAKEINHNVIIKKPHTNIYIDNTIYELDSIKAFLTFPLLSLWQRVRQLFVLGVLFKINPFWKPLEHFKAAEILPILIGKKAFNLIWKPQLYNKMRNYMTDVSLVWFWARVKKRTPDLAYPEEGFLAFAIHLTEILKKNGVTFYFNSEIEKLTQEKQVTIETNTHNKLHFDRAIITTPSFLFIKIAPQLPEHYKSQIGTLKGLGATNLILRLKKPFLPKNTYWLSMCNMDSPIMAIVEHTNFMSKSHYNNEHIVYLGNYPASNTPEFTASKEELLKKYHPLLTKINPTYKKNLISYTLFKAPFAQPIIPINYSQLLPSFKTPLSKVYLANIEQVYPWDRGTNYAIELGYKIADILSKDEKNIS